MKPIKITADNAAAIEAALKEVNGTATAHTYTDFSDIATIASNAEDALGSILYRKDHAGAQWRETSGGKVANSYRGTRIATSVTIERRSSYWYLSNVFGARIGNTGGGKGRLYLTQAQHDAACKRLAEQYTILGE